MEHKGSILIVDDSRVSLEVMNDTLATLREVLKKVGG